MRRTPYPAADDTEIAQKMASLNLSDDDDWPAGVPDDLVIKSCNEKLAAMTADGKIAWTEAMESKVYKLLGKMVWKLKELSRHRARFDDDRESFDEFMEFQKAHLRRLATLKRRDEPLSMLWVSFRSIKLFWRGFCKFPRQDTLSVNCPPANGVPVEPLGLVPMGDIWQLPSMQPVNDDDVDLEYEYSRQQAFKGSSSSESKGATDSTKTLSGVDVQKVEGAPPAEQLLDRNTFLARQEVERDAWMDAKNKALQEFLAKQEAERIAAGITEEAAE